MSNNKPHIYLISGLGADYKLFKKLNLETYNYTHVKWIDFKSKKQSISSYASDLTDQIKHKKPILIGISFGGILAIEIAKKITVCKTIAISCFKTKQELPARYKLPGFSYGVKMSPNFLFNRNSPALEYILGAKSEESKKIFNEIIESSNPIFVKWAITQVLKWNNESISDNIYHIHGEKDNLFPIKMNKVQYPIKNGGHLMIIEKGEEINVIINNLIENG